MAARATIADGFVHQRRLSTLLEPVSDHQLKVVSIEVEPNARRESLPPMKDSSSSALVMRRMSLRKFVSIPDDGLHLNFKDLSPDKEARRKSIIRKNVQSKLQDLNSVLKLQVKKRKKSVFSRQLSQDNPHIRIDEVAGLGNDFKSILSSHIAKLDHKVDLSLKRSLSKADR